MTRATQYVAGALNTLAALVFLAVAIVHGSSLREWPAIIILAIIGSTLWTAAGVMAIISVK